MDIYSLDGVETTVEIDRVNGNGEAIIEEGLAGDAQINLGRVHPDIGDEIEIKITVNQLGEGTAKCLDKSIYLSSKDSNETRKHDFSLPKFAIDEDSGSVNLDLVFRRKL